MAKIMIIDDDTELLETLSSELTARIPAVTTVTTRDSTDGAVSAILAGHPDLLILDVMYPEDPAAGFDLARKIRATKEIEKLPILLLTGINQELPMGFSTEDIDEDWFPVQDVMEKPVDILRLVARVEAFLKA